MNGQYRKITDEELKNATNKKPLICTFLRQEKRSLQVRTEKDYLVQTFDTQGSQTGCTIKNEKYIKENYEIKLTYKEFCTLQQKRIKKLESIIFDLAPWASAAQDDKMCCVDLKNILLRVVNYERCGYER